MSQISTQEREYLRNLAKRQKELANLPEMQTLTSEWYAHNGLQGERNMVVMEEETFLDEILPNIPCESPAARAMARQLLQPIVAYETFHDDKVVPDFFAVDTVIHKKMWQQEQKRTYAADGIAFHIEPILEDLETDLEILKESTLRYDKAQTDANIALAQDVLGDILDIKVINKLNQWGTNITAQIVDLMGTENMFCAMLTTPDEYHQLLHFVTEDILRTLRFEEEQGIIYLNNGNDYMGSGSYTFNHELLGNGGAVRSIDTFGHLNSQESVGISPAHYKEFVYPYNLRLSQEFGLLYYGCCEPVDPFWEDGIENYHNLRKVSISPWCNEAFMAERLTNSRVIYSRKPSPNYIGISKAFDADAFRAYIQNTVRLTRGCKAEFIFRDIYKLNGNTEKLRQAVDIVRQETTK